MVVPEEPSDHIHKSKQAGLALLRDTIGWSRTVTWLQGELRAMRQGRVAFVVFGLLCFLMGLKTCASLSRTVPIAPTPTASSQVIKLTPKESDVAEIDASKGPPLVYVLASGERDYEYTICFFTKGVATGTLAEVYVEIPKSNISGGPRIKIRNESANGKVMTEVYGDTSNPVYLTFRYHFDGVSWQWFP